MKILEQFIEGKSQNQALCEDDFFISENFVAVIDGATSFVPDVYDGKTSGRWAADTLKLALDSLLPQATAQEAVVFLSQALASSYQARGLLETFKNAPEKRPTASVALYSVFQKQIWCVGDCSVMVDGVSFDNTKAIDDLMLKARACFLQAEILLGKTEEELLKNDTGREFVSSLILKQRAFQNNKIKTTYSYDVFDGFCAENIEPKIIDVSNANEIILASDGYPKLFPTLKESEAYLKKLLKEDPLCYKTFLAFKGCLEQMNSFDDRVFLRLFPFAF